MSEAAVAYDPDAYPAWEKACRERDGLAVWLADKLAANQRIDPEAVEMYREALEAQRAASNRLHGR